MELCPPIETNSIIEWNRMFQPCNDDRQIVFKMVKFLNEGINNKLSKMFMFQVNIKTGF